MENEISQSNDTSPTQTAQSELTSNLTSKLGFHKLEYIKWNAWSKRCLLIETDCILMMSTQPINQLNGETIVAILIRLFIW